MPIPDNTTYHEYHAERAKRAKLSEETKAKMKTSQTSRDVPNTIMHTTKHCQYTARTKHRPNILKRPHKGVKYTEPIEEILTVTPTVRTERPRHRELLPKRPDNNIHLITARAIVPGHPTNGVITEEYTNHLMKEMVETQKKARETLTDIKTLIANMSKSKRRGYNKTDFTAKEYKEANQYLNHIKSMPSNEQKPEPLGTVGVIIDYYSHDDIKEICSGHKNALSLLKERRRTAIPLKDIQAARDWEESQALTGTNSQYAPKEILETLCAHRDNDLHKICKDRETAETGKLSENSLKIDQYNEDYLKNIIKENQEEQERKKKANRAKEIERGHDQKVADMHTTLGNYRLLPADYYVPLTPAQRRERDAAQTHKTITINTK